MYISDLKDTLTVWEDVPTNSEIKPKFSIYFNFNHMPFNFIQLTYGIKMTERIGHRGVQLHSNMISVERGLGQLGWKDSTRLNIWQTFDADQTRIHSCRDLSFNKMRTTAPAWNVSYIWNVYWLAWRKPPWETRPRWSDWRARLCLLWVDSWWA
jgi:hypothetical protein